MTSAMGKYTFGACADSKGPDQTVQMHASVQSDQDFCCLLTESLNT